MNGFLNNEKIRKIVLTTVVVLVCLYFFNLMFGKFWLNTDRKKASYAIGYDIGQNMKNQNLDVDPDIILMAIKDGKSGRNSKISPEELKQAVQNLQDESARKDKEAYGQKNTEERMFLDRNKKNSNMRVYPSGVQMLSLKEGTGKSPQLKNQVKIKYKGTLANGEIFESSEKSPEGVWVPMGNLVRGWQEAMTKMKEGGAAKIYVPSELGYGNMNRPGIPAYSVLIFEVELLEIK